MKLNLGLNYRESKNWAENCQNLYFHSVYLYCNGVYLFSNGINIFGLSFGDFDAQLDMRMNSRRLIFVESLFNQTKIGRPS